MKRLLILITLASVIAFSVRLAPTVHQGVVRQAASVPYMAGVKPGDSAIYVPLKATYYSTGTALGQSSSFSEPQSLKDLNATTRAKITIQTVSSPATNVTLQARAYYTNGTSKPGILAGDLASGDGNLTYWLIPGGLSKGMQLPGIPTPPGVGTPSINETVQMPYLGTVRTVNILNITRTENIAFTSSSSFKEYLVWDQTTGVLLELDNYAYQSQVFQGSEEGHIHLKIAYTDLWPVPNQSFSLSTPSPGSLTVYQGATSPTSTIDAALTTGPATTTLSVNIVSTLPTGVAPILTSTPCKPTCTITLSFSATLAASLGTVPITIEAYGNGTSHTTSLSLTIQAASPTFDYTLSISPSRMTIAAGQQNTATITATLTSGTPRDITLSGNLSPFPNVCVQSLYFYARDCGTYSITPARITLNTMEVSSVLNIDFTDNLPIGTYTLNITGSPASTTAPSAIFTLIVKRGNTLTVACSSVTIGHFTTCTATVASHTPQPYPYLTTPSVSYPSGNVTFATTSSTGTFTTTTCTLASGSCSVEYADNSPTNTTARITGNYTGDLANIASTGNSTLSVSKTSEIIAATATVLTLTNGQLIANQTSTTGVYLAITQSRATNGTRVGISTQRITQPNYPGTNPYQIYQLPGTSLNLLDPSYYDVQVAGISTGNARVCISLNSTSSRTTMEYENTSSYYTSPWKTASGVTVTGKMVCGQIPVSALTGTTIAVGSTIPPFDPTVLIITVVVALAGMFTLIAVVLRRARRAVRA